MIVPHLLPCLPSLQLQRFLGATARTEPGVFRLFLERWPQAAPVIAHLTLLTDGQWCHVVLMSTHFTLLQVKKMQELVEDVIMKKRWAMLGTVCLIIQDSCLS